MRSCLAFVGALSVVLLALHGAALASATPAPSATATPSVNANPSASPPPSDPCGSILSIVNRPSFGTGVCTVRTGHADLETGYTETVTTGTAGGNSVAYPQALLRVGTRNPHFDIELGAPSAARASVGGALSSGSTDASLGAKAVLGYTADMVWGVGASITLPTGSAEFSAGRTQYAATLNWAYAASPTVSLSGTFGANEFTAPDARGVTTSYFAAMPSLDATLALPGGPSQISAEYAYFTAAGPNLGGRSWFDFIYQRDFGARFQVDVEYGVSPTSIGGQAQHYVGAGLSFMQ